MSSRGNDGAISRWLLWSVALAYAGIGLLMMLLASPKVPYADPWRFLASYLETPFPANVLTADNGHREVLPNLVRLAELHWCDGNQWLQIGVGLALAVATVFLLVRSLGGAEPSVRAAATALVCIGVFWLGNARKLAHGNESVAMFFVLGLLVVGLRRLVVMPRDGNAASVWFAAGAGLLATLSFGSGIASFAAFAAVLVLQRAPGRHWLPIVVGGVFAATALLLGGPGESAAAQIAPVRQFDQLLRWLGAPFVWVLSPWLDAQHAARLPTDLLRVPTLAIATQMEHAFGERLAARWPAAAFGGAGLLWLVIATWRAWQRTDSRPAERLALGLAWFGCAVGVLVVTLRLTYFHVHPEQLTSGRYVPWSMLLWTGLLLGFVLRPGRSVRTATWTVLGVAMLLAPSQVWTGRAAWKQQRTAELTALGAAVGVLDRHYDLGESVAADLLAAVPRLRAAQKSMFAWPETQALGTRPGPDALVSVAVREFEIERVSNLFGPVGSGVKFQAEGAPGSRLVLVDATGTVRGLAVRLAFDELWRGWLRGEIDASQLRAAALR